MGIELPVPETSPEPSPKLLQMESWKRANASNEEFGEERLCNLLKTSGNMSAEETADLIQDTVNSWSPTQADDLTVLICDYK
jgi:hypothetical protein